MKVYCLFNYTWDGRELIEIFHSQEHAQICLEWLKYYTYIRTIDTWNEIPSESFPCQLDELVLTEEIIR